MTTSGSLTNRGLLTNSGSGTRLTVPAGHLLTNDGAILVPQGSNFVVTGDLLNASTGRIDLAQGSSFPLNGSTLTNKGHVTVSSDALLTTQGRPTRIA